MRATVALISAGAGLAVGIAGTWAIQDRHAHEAMQPPAAADAGHAREVLYWYDPMRPDQHFERPGKSPYMDMQLLPKYSDGAGADGTVRIEPRLVQNLGVRTAAARLGRLEAVVRATGMVAFDERLVSVVQARASGIVAELAVRSPLAAVTAGQPLLTLIVPDWTSAQEEYLALRGGRAPGMEDLRGAARQRLLLLGMSDAQIRNIESTGRAQARITITAPRAGVVGELAVREGASVVPGSPLMRINGLDTVWVDAAIPEVEAGLALDGAHATAEVPAFPGERIEGVVEALLPDLDPATRTRTARIVLQNPGHRLVPGMFARIGIDAADGGPRVLVPSEAVIATGRRSVVIVPDGGGRFRAREVRIGREAGGETELLEGLAAGDPVVLSGQFLIDSEASLTGALSRLEGNRERTP